ncbi:MAG: arsenate reductase (glutaredoxin) [Verrucomicrobiae bacterium]|nr:arsenate reductase (glutaredoxin) [Verrucomicrobiae bacterium]
MRLYYNPRCSKCRTARKILEDHESEIEVVEYLKHPPTPSELDAICNLLGIEPAQLVRTKETRFKELGLSLDDPHTRKEWLKILSDNPVLIERPILVKDGKAVIGRPPERIIDLLD